MIGLGAPTATPASSTRYRNTSAVPKIGGGAIPGVPIGGTPKPPPGGAGTGTGSYIPGAPSYAQPGWAGNPVTADQTAVDNASAQNDIFAQNLAAQLAALSGQGQQYADQQAYGQTLYDWNVKQQQQQADLARRALAAQGLPIDIGHEYNNYARQSLDNVLGIRNKGLNDAFAYLDQQRGTAGTDRSNAIALIQAQLGYAGQTRDSLARYYDRQQGSADKNYSLALARAGLERDVAGRTALSDATSRGAGLSAGFGAQLGEQARQYGNEATGAKNDRYATLSNIVRGQEASTIDYNTAATTLGNRQLGVENDYQAKLNALNNSGNQTQNAYNEWWQTGYYDQKTALNKSDAMLNAQAKQLGISRQQLDQSLRSGLEKLGIDNADLQRRMQDAIASNNTQQQALIQQIYQQAATAGAQ